MSFPHEPGAVLEVRGETWKLTRVRPGFVDRPVDKLSDQILKESADAAERVLDSIARG